MSRSVLITTIDNPFDPKTQFDEWYAYDTKKGYNSCAYLARIAKVSEALSEQENSLEIERAIDEIVLMNGLYKKIVYNS